MKKIFLLFILGLFIFIGCAEQSTVASIIPQKCEISAGQEFPVALQGQNLRGEIRWAATKGKVNPSSGTSVIYTAPDEPGPVVITAEMEAGNVKNTYTLLCEIIVTEPTVVLISSPEPASSIETLAPTQLVEPVEKTIAITEVMAAPCGAAKGPNRNEYIELYNYGEMPIDVAGWWIGVNGGGAGSPDEIVSWYSKTSASLGNNVVTDTTIIPPSGFAVILPPVYHLGGGMYFMPYIFPEDTIILSINDSDYLGNDTVSLLGTTDPATVIVLYRGTASLIDEVISTYGTPIYGASANNIRDNNSDNVPLQVLDCYSVERINPSGADIFGNWRTVFEGNPGSADYSP